MSDSPGNSPSTTIEAIEVAGLLSRVDALKSAGWRLVQVLAISGTEAIELDYSFGLGHQMLVLRFLVAPGVAVPSITSVYAAAFLYENEIRDLFGVGIERISLDWLGKVFDVAADRPFSKIKVTLPSSEEGKR